MPVTVFGEGRPDSAITNTSFPLCVCNPVPLKIMLFPVNFPSELIRRTNEYIFSMFSIFFFLQYNVNSVPIVLHRKTF